MKVPSGLRIDSPSWPLLQAHISYWGITTLAGNALGTTLVDALCSTAGLQPNYAGLAVKILDGGAAGQVRQIAVHALATGTITITAPWTNYLGAVQQIAAGTRFVILSVGGGAAGPPPAPPAPGVSLWMFGVCDPGMGASLNTLVLTNLAGFNDAIFANEFWIQILHNTSVPGNAPEREIRRVTAYAGATGTFTVDPFSANVEANDLVCVFHESIMSVEILGFGTIDTSSATVPADSTRPGLYAWEVNDYFRGCLLMTTEGAARFAPRRIVEYTNATGIFTLDPNNPFPAASGDVDYIIIGDQTEFIPPVDGLNNRTPSDVIGGKADTALYAAAVNASLMRYIKGILNAKIEATGEADAGSDADTLVDAVRTEANDYWNGMTLLMITGANAGLARRIYDYAVGSIEVRDAFPNAIVATDVYVILSDYEALLAAVDGVENLLVRDVIGSKASTAIYAKDDVSDIIRYLKGLVDSQITASGVADIGSGVGLIRDAARTEVDDWWNGQTVLMLTGAAAFQKRPITDFVAATDDIIVAPNFDAAVAAGDIYVILAHYNMIVPRAADDVANALTSQVIGRKDDTALYAAAVNATLMRYVKGLITAGIAVPGAVDDVGAAITDFATTLTEPTDDHYNGMLLMFIDGPNIGQAHTIDDYDGGTKNVSFRVGDQWTDIPIDGNSFVILPSAALYTVAGITGATGIFHEQADVGFTENITAAETFIVTLTDADTRYILRDLRIKSADPGLADTITVKLYTLINSIEVNVDSFIITNANFTTYFTLADMFGSDYIAGDSIRVSLQGSAAGPYVVAGQWSHGKNNV